MKKFFLTFSKAYISCSTIASLSKKAIPSYEEPIYGKKIAALPEKRLCVANVCFVAYDNTEAKEPTATFLIDQVPVICTVESVHDHLIVFRATEEQNKKVWEKLTPVSAQLQMV